MRRLNQCHEIIAQPFCLHGDFHAMRVCRNFISLIHLKSQLDRSLIHRALMFFFILVLEFKFKLIPAHHDEPNDKFVKLPSWRLSTWKSFANKWFFMPKRCFQCDLGLMAAFRLVNLLKTNHAVHDSELVRLQAWSFEHGLGADMNLNIYYLI